MYIILEIYRYILIIWAWYKCGTGLVQGSLYDTNPNNALSRGNPSKTTFAKLENLVLIPPKNVKSHWMIPVLLILKFATLLWGFKKTMFLQRCLSKKPQGSSSYSNWNLPSPTQSTCPSCFSLHVFVAFVLGGKNGVPIPSFQKGFVSTH